MFPVDRFAVRRRLRPGLAAAALGSVAVLACACSHAGQSQAGSDQLTIWLTGYSWQDNTPPGSSVVGEPIIHKVAGGTGTFADPITVASTGHAGDQEWKPGTKFYLPTVQRYVMVEDSGAAKAPKGTDTHLDMWIGGEDGTKQATDDCMNTFTGKVPAQVNPPANLPVMAGEIFAGGQCHVPPQPKNLGTYKDVEDSGDSDDGDSSDGDDQGSDNKGSDDGDSGGHHHHHHHHHSDDDDGDGN